MFVDLMGDIHHTFTERFLRAQLVFNPNDFMGGRRRGAGPGAGTAAPPDQALQRAGDPRGGRRGAAGRGGGVEGDGPPGRGGRRRERGRGRRAPRRSRWPRATRWSWGPGVPARSRRWVARPPGRSTSPASGATIRAPAGRERSSRSATGSGDSAPSPSDGVWTGDGGRGCRRATRAGRRPNQAAACSSHALRTIAQTAPHRGAVCTARPPSPVRISSDSGPARTPVIRELYASERQRAHSIFSESSCVQSRVPPSTYLDSIRRAR